MDEVLREALVLKEGEGELFAPREECQPFCIEALQEQKSPALMN